VEAAIVIVEKPTDNSRVLISTAEKNAVIV